MARGYKKRVSGNRKTYSDKNLSGKWYTFIAEEEGTGRVRLGRTKDLPARMEQLRAEASRPLRLLRMIRGFEHEEVLKRNLSPYRVKGSAYLFEKTPDLIRYVNTYRRGDTDFCPIDHAPLRVTYITRNP